MSILGKYTENIDNRRDYEQSSSQQKSDFVMPAVTREEDDDSISLKKGIVISSILHPSTILSLWLILTTIKTILLTDGE